MTSELSPADRQQRHYWDDHADRYDRGMRFVERHVLRDSRAWACRQAAGRTVEVAIGTGLNLPWYPADVDLVGIELSPRMLAGARRRAADLGVNADLREGTALALDLEDDSVDTVVCTLALCSIPDDRVAVAEMVRVLRPGGRLVLVDHVASSWPPVRRLQRVLERWTVPNAGEHFTRQPIDHLAGLGMRVERHDRFLAGVIERVTATKPGQ